MEDEEVKEEPDNQSNRQSRYGNANTSASEGGQKNSPGENAEITTSREKPSASGEKKFESDEDESLDAACYCVNLWVYILCKWWEEVTAAKSFPLDTMLSHQPEVEGR